MAVSFSRPVSVNHQTNALAYDGGSPSDGPLKSGNYYMALTPGSSNTSGSLGVGTLRLAPCYIPTSVTIDRIGAEVATAGEAGSKFRIGIYADNGSGYPGALALDAGTIAGDSNTVQEITVSAQLAPGLYWFGGAVQVVSVTQPTMRISNAPTTWQLYTFGTSAPSANQTIIGYQQASVTGALPSTFSASVSTSGAMTRVFFRIA